MTDVDWKYAGAVAAMMAGCGVAVGIGMLAQFDRLITATVPAPAFLAAAGLGAGLAGGATHYFFGRAGMRGMALAFLGALLATGLGAFLAAVVALSPGRWDLALVALVFSAVSPVTLLWLVAMGLVQAGALRLRRSGGGRVAG